MVVQLICEEFVQKICACVTWSRLAPTYHAKHVTREGVPEEACYQKKADTRMVLHAVHAAANGCPAVLLNSQTLMVL